MSRIERLLQGWDYAYDKEDWYPPLADALRGIDAAEAAWKPESSSVNSIWQTVNHMIFYKERLLKRLTGEETEYPKGVTNDDTFSVDETGDQAWNETLARLDRVHRGIREKLAGMNDAELDDALPGGKLEGWADSLIRHDAYHAGQIILLRKLRDTWPANRSFE
ncbi:DinB family protein [Cohnella caldifontis]|uniref:DinB family protein n=1 Tax=Cohnella caldifontis TaxID=3027471 RepID=UPI0023EC0918|nr:DinB family protein [Cohnella sp. YIM B05605]